MLNKILFCALFVGIHRTIKDQSKIGSRGGGGEVRARHEDGSGREEFIRVGERTIADIWVIVEADGKNSLGAALPRGVFRVRGVVALVGTSHKHFGLK